MRKKTLFQVKKITIAAIMLITSFSLVSCEGEEGPQGPPGEDANVNTEIFNVAGEEWEEDGSMYVVEKTSDLLTQEIIDNGSAHLYLKANADAENDVWIALPYQTMGFAVTVNNLVILTEGSDVTNSTTTFKLVVISGSTMSKNSGVDFNNYTEVKEHFNLSD